MVRDLISACCVIFIGILKGGVANGRELVSPFPSTVKNVSIPNTHVLARAQGVVLRGMTPRTKEELRSLSEFGIDEILIFRNDVAGEPGIKEELALINETPKIRAVHLIPFKWKEINEFRAACRDTLRGLKLIQNALLTAESGLFFHCTVGEDRTGYLAGLYRVIFENAASDKVFSEEMCAHGYAEGDPGKPKWVSKIVHENITVLFIKMLALVGSGKLSASKLDMSACNTDPGAGVEFGRPLPERFATLKCKQPAGQ